MAALPHPSPSPRNPAIRLSLFYAGYFLVGGVLFPFWPLLLEARGMGAGQIGLLLALALWLRAAAGPLVARHADRSGDSKKPLIACAAAALAVMPAFYWAAGFWPLLFATFAFFFAYSSVAPLAETIALRTVSAEAGYGRVRLWGSVSFVAAAIAGGLVLDARGGLTAATIVTLLLITLAILLAAAFALPRAPPEGARRAPAPLKTLLGSKPFLLFLLTTAMIHAAHGVYYGFSTIHWTSIGLSHSTVGLLWGGGVLAEILLFAFGAPLVRADLWCRPGRGIAAGGLALRHFRRRRLLGQRGALGPGRAACAVAAAGLARPGYYGTRAVKNRIKRPFRSLSE